MNIRGRDSQSQSGPSGPEPMFAEPRRQRPIKVFAATQPRHGAVITTGSPTDT